MSKPTYIATLDKALAPLGFARPAEPDPTGDRVWVRRRGDVQDTISHQVSAFGRGSTANLWTHNVRTEALLREAIPWERPLYIVGGAVRIGQLIDPKTCDKWWKNDPNGPKEMADAL